MVGDVLLHNKINALFSKQLNLQVPSLETDLVEAGMLDSLTFVELLFQLEQEFGTKVSIEQLEIDNFRSIAKIAEFVANFKGARGNKKD
jgi:acyl carrier protein